MGPAQLQLTRNKFALVDAEELQRCNEHLWYFNPINGYAHTFINRKIVYLHRFITGVYIDHKNRNKLDCRKENLRACSHIQNCHNRVSNRNGTSSYKGVHYNSGRSCWYAKIFVNGKSKHIGRFDIEIEAAQAYDKVAIENFGEFAVLNLQ